ncbi:FAR1-RELATED SEQUENCE 11-like protein [Drosera capensis]
MATSICLLSQEDRSSMLFYEDPSDERSLSLDEASSADDSPEETRHSLEGTSDPVPYIGQRFATHDAAYDFYTEFARRSGFSIRRHRTEGKDGVGKGLIRRYFVCHRAGRTPNKVNNDQKPQRNRKSWRCGCQAYLRISKKVEVGVTEWHVTGFANHHNHRLLEANQVRFLPAYRTISDADKSRILMYAKTEISVHQMMRLMELEKCVEPGNLPYTEKDIRNLIQSFRKAYPEEETVNLLRMCRNIKERDPNFRFEYTLDFNNQVENIAWSFSSSVQAYEVFGDAVVLDTTHRLAAFDMSLGIWVGINNYGMPCFFGCALLQEEDVKSFSWAIKAFLGFMNGKAPKTILTDQDMCLKEAVSTEMPTSRHALCVRLIVAKFPSWFNAVLGERYTEWKAEFFRLYSMGSVEDFEYGWREMVSSYALHGNKHIANLFYLRSLWALPYLRSHFFAGLTATGSKLINSFIQRFVSTQTRLPRFLQQLADAVEFKDQAGEQQTMLQNVQNICLKTGAPMESHASTILTPYAFSKLQEQMVLAAHYASYQMKDGFLVRHHTVHEGGHRVYFVPGEGLVPPTPVAPSNSLPSKTIPSAHSGHMEKVQALRNMVANLVAESAKSRETLDLATQQVSALLSRITEQPALSQDARYVHRNP